MSIQLRGRFPSFVFIWLYADESVRTGAFASYCSSSMPPGQEYPTLVTYTEVHRTTVDGADRFTHGTELYVHSYSTVDLGFCKTASVVPDSILYTTRTVSMGKVRFVITAGAEKLGPRATTGASPTSSGTQPTGTGGAGTEKKGAAPMMTMAPVWAGLGVAAAALAL